MTTETILTDEEIQRIGLEMPTMPLKGSLIKFARAIEQAVLQSEQVQSLRKDAARLDWLESSQHSHGFCHTGFGDYMYYAHQLAGYKTVREVIDAAMENQNERRKKRVADGGWQEDDALNGENISEKAK